MFCSSAGLPTHVTPESLFCSSAAEGDLMHKIFVPSCAADGFEFTLPGVLRELNEVFQLNVSHSVTFGGTGNAARGLTKHLPLLESYSNAKLILDSSVDMDGGILHNALQRAQLPVLMLQSQYDLVQLGVRVQNLTQYAALLEVEAFGLRMRSTLHGFAQFPNVRVVSRACGTFGYVLPTKIHINTRNITHAGFNLAVSRNVVAYREIESELKQFIETGSTTPALIADTCQSFLCNPTCQERIDFHPAEFTPANDRLYAFVMTNTMLLLVCIMLGFVVIYRLESTTLVVNLQDDATLYEGAFPHLLDLFAVQPESLQLSIQTLGLTYIAKKSKPILRNVSVRFEATKLHAIVGMSGGGKTTLLELLARTRHDGLAIGEHACFDAQHQSCDDIHAACIGLVKQQDFFFDTLTVMEHLRYVCCLKLRGEEDEVAIIVGLVIKLFGFGENRLWECKIDQLSGGERKRLSIATQFVFLPRILLLDEPTSGLDANQAYRIAQILKLCCTKHGMTVVMTIHQARQEIFTLVDTLTLLFDGKVLVTGENPQAVFMKFGIHRGNANNDEINLADELMDLISSATQLPSFAGLQQQPVLSNAQQRSTRKQKKRSNAMREIAVLVSRTIQRGGFDFLTNTIWIALLGGVLICIVFYNPNNNGSSPLRLSFEPEIRLDYVLLCGIVFLQGVFVGDRYWMERFMFDFERNAGVQVRHASFIAALLLRFTVTSTLETLAFVAAPSWLLLPHDNHAIERTLVLLLCGLCTCFQYIWVETIFIKPHDKQTAAHVNVAMLSASFLFNGFILRKSDLPWYLAWIPKCIASYWSFAGLLTLDLRGQTLDCRPGVSKLYCALQGSGDALLEVMGFDAHALPHCVLVLVGMWFGFALLICLSLQLRQQNIWVLEDDKPNKRWNIVTRKNRYIFGLLVADLLLSVMYVVHFSVGVYLTAGFAFLILCGVATWSMAANNVWAWVTLPVEVILLVFQSQVLLDGSGVIVIQRLVRVWRIAILLTTTQDQHDDEAKQEEEEMRLLVQ